MRVTTSDKPAFRVNVVVRALLVCVALLPISARGELPGPGPNLELIPAGSLIIAMDNDKQNIGATFNLSAYGLANHLLWQGVRVKWAIRAGKTKDGIDFTVAAQRVQPTPTAPTTLGFRGGPFIVHRDDAAYALPRIIASRSTSARRSASSTTAATPTSTPKFSMPPDSSAASSTR